MSAFIHKLFPTTELTPGVRLLALFISLVSIPFVAFGLFPFALPFSLPGIILFYHYWYIAADAMKARKARRIFAYSAIYNLVLAIIAVVALPGREFPVELIPLNFLAWSLLGYKMLKDKEEETLWDAGLLTELSPQPQEDWSKDLSIEDQTLKA